MSDLLLAEQLFLLAHDDASGRADSTTAINNGYAGALLLDLASGGLIVIEGKKLQTAPGRPAHPLLAEAYDQLAGSGRPRRPDHWVSALPGALKPLDVKIGRSLVQRGVLSEQRATRLGLFHTTVWPEQDPRPERDLRARLAQVLVTGTEPDPQLGLLIALLRALEAIDRVVERPDRKQARARAKQIAERAADGKAVSAAVSRSVQAVHAAVVAAVIVPTIVAST